MSKAKKRRIHKKTSRKKVHKPIQIQKIPIEKVSIWKKIWTVIKKGWVIVVIIGVVLGLVISSIALKDQIHKWITPQQKLYEEENFIKGIIIPNYTDSYPDLNIFYGSFTISYSIEKFKQGINITPDLIKCAGEPPGNIGLKIIDGKLFVSTEILDLDDKLVGVIDYNKWSLFKPNLLTYHETDNSLEVIDRYNNVVLSILFISPNTISLQGYFMEKKEIIVLSHAMNCFPKNDIESAKEAIRTIKRINPF